MTVYHVPDTEDCTFSDGGTVLSIASDHKDLAMVKPGHFVMRSQGCLNWVEWRVSTTTRQIINKYIEQDDGEYLQKPVNTYRFTLEASEVCELGEADQETSIFFARN